MDTPPVPPYGALIEGFREAAGASMQRAADLAGVSKQTWNDVVKGYTPAPRPRTVARMARAVGVPPERLESEGAHPAAAGILRGTGAPPPARPEGMRLAPPAGPASKAARASWPHDEWMQRLTDLPAVTPEEDELKAALITAYVEGRRERRERGDGPPGARSGETA